MVIDADPMETVTGDVRDSRVAGDMDKNPDPSHDVESTFGSVEEPAGIKTDILEVEPGLRSKVLLRS